ncbi:OmpA family protein [Xenorhabdus szentirmaii]|uniref:OmpA family protein n=1 Tax=Xenorhabdus szentirmaii TaxID=290112 RepID=UPI000C0433DE|nr:OmpA family protein [Xenorhabdus szentirmaii]PHM42189.1 putative type VI secretion protein [Xenorhabdus szentirmaii]
MRILFKQGLCLLAVLLAGLLIWGFWHLGNGMRLLLTLVTLAIVGGLIFRWRSQVKQYQEQHTSLSELTLPAEDFRGALVLVCGHSQDLFSQGVSHRETLQGWYISTPEPKAFVHTVQHIAENASGLLANLSVMFSVAPEKLHDQDKLQQSVLEWRRALGESRQWIGHVPPFWVCSHLNPLIKPDTSSSQASSTWFTLHDAATGFQVRGTTQTTQSLSAWSVSEKGKHLPHSSEVLWLDQFVQWLNKQFLPLLALPQPGTPSLTPCAVALAFAPVKAVSNNLWLQQLSGTTTLGVPSAADTDNAAPLPFPDVLLTQLPRHSRLTTIEVYTGIAGVIGGVFLLLALLASYSNNKRLLTQIQDDLVLFHRLEGEPVEPKMQAWNRLKDDANLLSEWHRKGEPVSHSLGLYQGQRMLPPVQDAIASWAPPLPPEPEPEPEPIVEPTPQTVSLDSLALFGVGKSALKPDANKVLISALVQIKGQSGHQIVISGYTDNTGNSAFNQRLSLKRAEAVRDWMLQNSDIPAACFRVQGYGSDHPVASNDTEAGRAANRRVEIRLVPQANGCQAPASLSSPELGEELNHVMEK